MSSPSSSRNQPSSPLVQRKPIETSTTSIAPSPQNTATEKAASSSAATTATLHTFQRTSLEKFLEWILKVLGFAAACIFGAWAPLSYKATLDGNSGSDASQSSMVSAAIAVSSQASAAASQASAAASQQSVALDSMNNRIGAIGQLWLYDFYIAQTNLGPCNTFTSQFSISSLVSYLASTVITTIPGQSSTLSSITTPTFSLSAPSSSNNITPISNSATSFASTGTSPPTSQPPQGAVSAVSTLAVPAILGIVFAVLIALGLLLGVWLFLVKKQRNTRNLQ